MNIGSVFAQAETGAELGVLSVPSEASQGVADALIAAGIRGLLNFTPQVLRVPSGVSVVSVDLTVQLEHLAFLLQLSKGRGPGTFPGTSTGTHLD